MGPYVLEKRNHRKLFNDSSFNVKNMIFGEDGVKLTCFKYLPKTELLMSALHPDLGGGIVSLRPSVQKLNFSERHNHEIEDCL